MRNCNRKSTHTPETEPYNKDSFRVLIYKDFWDEQLLDLPMLIEWHGSPSHTMVELFVENGIDMKRFCQLMASVRKAAPHIRFEINLKMSTETLDEIEREHVADGGTVFESEF